MYEWAPGTGSPRTSRLGETSEYPDRVAQTNAYSPGGSTTSSGSSVDGFSVSICPKIRLWSALASTTL